MLIQILVRSLVLFLFITVSATAVDSQVNDRRAALLKQDAKKYYWGLGQEQDYAIALALYESAAALGDPEANYIAGGMYYTGKGTPRNLFKAFQYLQIAAQSGKSSPEANRALAEFYILGEVVPKNYQKALIHYKEAAEDGDPISQLELGYLYFTGRGIEQDYNKAFEWFRKAAVSNNTMAQYNMGIIWYTGNGVEQSDIYKAYGWMSVAAANNYTDAIQVRDFLESSMSISQIQRGQKIAEALFDEIHGLAAAPNATRE